MTDDLNPRAMQGLLALADELAAAGAVRSPKWRAAVLATPRQVFLPRFFHPDPVTGELRRTTAREPDWLEVVYSDQPLATQFNGVPRDTSGVPTSSSTAPSLMPTMLELLDLDEGQTVLEIGTGTGYNAGLLSNCTGDHNVTTVDIDGALTGLARERLAVLGLHPTVVTGDGAVGYSAKAPYDRIIATCAVRRIPLAWLEQAKPGGKILVTVESSLHGYALALLTVDEAHRAIGRLLPEAASFMPMRSHADPLFADLRKAAVPSGRESTTSIQTQDLESNDARFAIGLQLPGVAAFEIHTAAGTGLYLAHHTNGSWAELHPDHMVTAGGPTDLWQDLEVAYRGWVNAGHPAPHQLKLSLECQEDHLELVVLT